MADRTFVELGTRQLARALHVSQRTVQRRARAGRYTASRDPRGRYIIPSPTSVAARALGRSPSTIRRQVATGKLAGFKGTEREVERRYAGKPPAELARQAGTVGRPSDVVGMTNWIETQAPAWIRDMVLGPLAAPVQAGIIFADRGLPPAAQWTKLTLTPSTTGYATIVLMTDDGRRITFRMPQAVAWDMRRVLIALGVEVEVRDTP